MAPNCIEIITTIIIPAQPTWYRTERFYRDLYIVVYSNNSFQQ